MYTSGVEADFDARVRAAVFDFLDRRLPRNAGVIEWGTLQRGVEVDGRRIPLASMQGIFKPAALDLPLSLRTAPPRPEQPPPYEDDWEGEVLRYAFRHDDARGRAENASLVRAMEAAVPLVYLLGLDSGRYFAHYPVYIVDADMTGRTVTLDDVPPGMVVVGGEDRRRYRVRQVRSRLHQARFRSRVVAAYRTSCAMCRLHRAELVDAAHIIPDPEEHGVPEVPNGLSLCKIHHAAFDAHLLGVQPDLVIQVQPELLDAIDGPMLRHGLQALHGQRLMVVPRRRVDRPSRLRLEQRYEAFLAAG